MRALDLDFRRQPAAWTGWAMLALALALGADAAYTWYGARQELAELRAAAGRPLAGMALRERAAALQDPAVAADLRFAGQVLNDLALPWEELFRTIEGAADDERVALLSVQPDANKGTLQLTGEAGDYAAILTFIGRLEESPVLHGVHLMNHELREADGRRPFFFTLGASWRAGG